MLLLITNSSRIYAKNYIASIEKNQDRCQRIYLFVNFAWRNIVLRGESYIEKSEGQRNADEWAMLLGFDGSSSWGIEIALSENVGQGMFYFWSLPFIVPKI